MRARRHPRSEPASYPAPSCFASDAHSCLWSTLGFPFIFASAPFYDASEQRRCLRILLLCAPSTPTVTSCCRACACRTTVYMALSCAVIERGVKQSESASALPCSPRSRAALGEGVSLLCRAHGRIVGTPRRPECCASIRGPLLALPDSRSRPKPPVRRFRCPAALLPCCLLRVGPVGQILCAPSF